MPNRSHVRALALFLATAGAAPLGSLAAQTSGPATTWQLSEITERGRALASYERAVWQAYGQLLLKRPDPRLVQRYIAYHADSGWAVAFGRLSVKLDAFYVSHLAIPAVVGGKRVDTLFIIQSFEKPGADTDYLLRAARAVDSALALLGPTPRPYDVAALPTANGEWWVYVIPGPNRSNVWPLGDDTRYRFSADGRRILERRRMHLGILEFDRMSKPEASRFVAGVHNTEISDAPEDTDVFHVLTRKPRVFEYVFTPRYLYMINEDGSIRFVLGRS